MSSKISSVKDDIDASRDLRPGESFELGPGRLVSREVVGLVCGNARSHVFEIYMGSIERNGEGLQMAGSFSEDEEIVGQHSGDGTQGMHEEGPRPHEEANEHHRHRTSLWDAASPAVFSSKIANKIVDNTQVLKKIHIGKNDGPRNASEKRNEIKERPLNLVKALFNVGCTSGERLFVDGGMLDVKRGEVPSILRSRRRDTGIHVVGRPSEYPWLKRLQSGTGPQSVKGRGDEQRSVG